MPGSGPVPQEQGHRRQVRPASRSPPARTSSQSLSSPGKNVALVRNDRTGTRRPTPIRKALPDQIDLTITTNADDIDNHLLDGDRDLDIGQTGVQAGRAAKILLDPT